MIYDLIKFTNFNNKRNITNLTRSSSKLNTEQIEQRSYVKIRIIKRKSIRKKRTKNMFKSIGSSGGGGNGGGGGGGCGSAGGTFFHNPMGFGDKLNQSYNQYRSGPRGPDRYARSKPVKIKKHQYRHHPNGELTINLTRNEPRLVICNSGGGNGGGTGLLNQQLNSVNNHIGQLSIGNFGNKFANRLSNSYQSKQPQQQVHSSRYKFLNNNFHTTSCKSNSNGNNANNNNNNHYHKHHYHHHHHHNNHHVKKQLSAPYNTTQYIMYDYSKRKSNESEQGQFSHDWNMALAAADDDKCKCNVVVIGESSSTEPVDDVQRPSSSAMDDEDHQNDSMNIISNNKFSSKSDNNLFSLLTSTSSSDQNPTSSTNLSVSV